MWWPVFPSYIGLIAFPLRIRRSGYDYRQKGGFQYVLKSLFHQLRKLIYIEDICTSNPEVQDDYWALFEDEYEFLARFGDIDTIDTSELAVEKTQCSTAEYIVDLLRGTSSNTPSPPTPTPIVPRHIQWSREQINEWLKLLVMFGLKIKHTRTSLVEDKGREVTLYVEKAYRIGVPPDVNSVMRTALPEDRVRQISTLHRMQSPPMLKKRLGNDSWTLCKDR